MFSAASASDFHLSPHNVNETDLGKMEKNFDFEVVRFKDDVSRFINKVENTLMYVPEAPSSTKKKVYHKVFFAR